MPTLPAHPDLDQLRRRAKELLQAAKAGDPDAVRRLEAVSHERTLAAAQLAVAREHGFASWPALKVAVEAQSSDLVELAAAFCRASVGNRPGPAYRLLAETPAIATAGAAPAAILGDAERVAAELRRDPGLASRREPPRDWTLLHLACASRWHALEPARADGLLAVVRGLLDTGAPLDQGRGWSALRCAVASAGSGTGNEPIVRLLLDRGAVPNDHDLYLAGFAADPARLLRLLLERVPDVRGVVAQAFAAPFGNDDAATVRVLLEAGADPDRYLDDDGNPCPAVQAAIEAGAELVELLLEHGADPEAAGLDGRSPYRTALARGRDDVAEVLRRHGARDDTTAADRLVVACLRGDRAEALRLSGEAGELTRDEHAALARAAGEGNVDAVTLMLELGFPLGTRGGDEGATALHAAAYAGKVDVVRLLVDRGADLEARDESWNSTPLEWAAVGSGERRPGGDWVETARVLLDAGASSAGISLSPDEPKSPSAAVAELLRSRAL
jgi:ankyrin repeat protein